MNRGFKKWLQKLFFFDEWLIGVADITKSSVINDKIINNFRVSWIKNPSQLTFRADPFIFQILAKKYIIFEQYSQILKRGRIAIGELQGNKIINETIIIDDKKHLSYPYIFIDNEQIFLICESYKSKKSILYKINQDSLKVEKVREIFSNQEAIDPTIFKFNNKYWLFYSKAQKPNEDLYLAYSNSLFDDFIQHPQNPIKSCIKSSRSAGSLFCIDDKIFRPAQNCQNFYGEKITINKINILDENNFVEEFYNEILIPQNNKKICGIHTISFFGNSAIIDGFNKNLVIYKPLISLYRNFIKIILK